MRTFKLIFQFFIRSLQRFKCNMYWIHGAIHLVACVMQLTATLAHLKHIQNNHNFQLPYFIHNCKPYSKQPLISIKHQNPNKKYFKNIQPTTNECEKNNKFNMEELVIIPHDKWNTGVLVEFPPPNSLQVMIYTVISRDV